MELEIDFHAAPGEQLPMALDLLVQTSSTSDARAADCKSEGFKQMRVLIIDDSQLMRNTLRQHLECIGCSVVAEAENTLQGLNLFRNVAPDLVILDVAVPQTGGIGALALFRIMRNELPQVPLLVISALAFPEVRRSFLKEGAIEYLTKPLTAQSFEVIRKRLAELSPPQPIPIWRAPAARPTLP